MLTGERSSELELLLRGTPRPDGFGMTDTDKETRQRGGQSGRTPQPPCIVLSSAPSPTFDRISISNGTHVASSCDWLLWMSYLFTFECDTFQLILLSRNQLVTMKMLLGRTRSVKSAKVSLGREGRENTKSQFHLRGMVPFVLHLRVVVDTKPQEFRLCVPVCA